VPTGSLLRCARIAAVCLNIEFALGKDDRKERGKPLSAHLLPTAVAAVDAGCGVLSGIVQRRRMGAPTADASLHLLESLVL
jgi:hypothetical protein